MSIIKSEPHRSEGQLERNRIWSRHNR